MRVEKKASGKSIDYLINGSKVLFNNELEIDINNYAGRYDVTVDICMDKAGKLYIKEADYYAARIFIPAKVRNIDICDPDDFGFCVLNERFDDVDLDKVVVTLYPIDDEKEEFDPDNGKACQKDCEKTKFALEAMTGGKNTLIYDDLGKPSVMVKIPAFKWSDVFEDGEDSLCSAFIVNGKAVDYIYISKYLNVIEDGRAYSLPGRDPAHTVSLETAREACARKGKGWHLMTNAEWMAIAFWCQKNKTEPRGNNFKGQDFNCHHETGVLSHGESLGVPFEGRTLTGSGPVAWNHDGTVCGITDLNGNIWDMVAGLRLMDGEIQIIPDNDSAMNVDEGVDSSYWRAILPSGELVMPGTPGTLKVDGESEGSDEEKSFAIGKGVVLSDEVKYPQYSGDVKGGHFGYAMTYLKDIQARDVEVPSIAKEIGIFPNNMDDATTRFFARSYGERIPIRGGSWFDKAGAGVFELYMRDHRHFIYPDIGFRAAYIDL